MRTISPQDRSILRDVARRQLELANEPRNKAIEKDWLLHNTFQGSRPMIHLELWTFEQDILPPLLRCKSEAAREVEAQLYRHFLNQEMFGDDHPIPDYYPVRWKTWFHLFGYEPNTIHVQNGQESGLGYRVESIISDLENDYGKLGASEYGVDRETSLGEEAFLNELFGDILPVRRVSDSLYAVPTQQIVKLMGMENMYFAMSDSPELFCKMMDRVAEDTIAYFQFMEKKGLILPTTGAQRLNQGSFCYTDELPAELPEGRPLSSTEVWGFLDSQESVGISPAMFSEFIFPCYKRIAGVYGLLSYGCCEPVHAVWDDTLADLPNLRKVSISPWCDEEKMGERLRGRKTVFHRKPSPNYLGTGGVLEEDALRSHFTATLRAARGCTLEFTQRDVYTIDGNIAKAQRYVQLLRETIAENWQG